MDKLLTLHRDVFAGTPGELFMGAMAILLLMSLISGAVVYGPFMRRLEFGTIRLATVKKLPWFDLHNLLGIVGEPHDRNHKISCSLISSHRTSDPTQINHPRRAW